MTKTKKTKKRSKFINPKTGLVSHWSAFEKKKKKK